MFALYSSQDLEDATVFTMKNAKEELKENMDLLRDYKTPAKKKIRRSLEEDDMELDFLGLDTKPLGDQDFLSGGSIISSLFTKWREVLEQAAMETGSEDSGLAGRLQVVKSDLEALEEVLTAQCNSLAIMSVNTSETKGLVEALFKEVRRLDAGLGKQNLMLQNTGAEATVWDAIASMMTTMYEGRATVEELVRELSTYSSDFNNTKRDIIQLFGDYKKAIEKVQMEVFDIQSHIVPPSTSHASISGVTPGTPSAFASLGISMAGSAGGYGSSSGGVAPSLSAGITGVAASSGVGSGSAPSLSAGTLEARVNALEEINDARENSSLAEAVRVMGITFTQQDDVENWLVANGPDPHKVPSYGLFLDPIMFYHWIWCELGGSVSSDAMLRRKKLGLNHQELMAVESFESGTKIPMIFAGERGGKGNTAAVAVSAMDKSRLGNVPSHAAFNNPLNGVGLKQKIKKLALLIRSSISKMIQRVFKNHPLVYALANDMLEGSYTFILSLNEYMTSTYSHFQVMQVGTEKEIWSLITYVVEDFFMTDFAKARSEAIGAIEPEGRDSGFRAIWCAMRSVSLARRLMADGIKDAPAVSASYVRFVLTQSNMGKVSNLNSEIQSLKDKVKSQESEIAAIKTIANNAKKAADAAASKCALLQNRQS